MEIIIREEDYMRFKEMEKRFNAYPELRKAMTVEEKEDYLRLKEMEKRINVYPDLRKAVRAAIEHEDRKIDLYLGLHVKRAEDRQDECARESHQCSH